MFPKIPGRRPVSTPPLGAPNLAKTTQSGRTDMNPGDPLQHVIRAPINPARALPEAPREVLRNWRSDEAKTWADAHHARSVANFVAPNEAMKARLDKRLVELTPKNPAPQRDYGGAAVTHTAEALVLRGADGAERRLIDTRELPAGHRVVDFEVSPDGRRVAFGYALPGVDRQTWQVRDIETQSNLLHDPVTFNSFGHQGMKFDPNSSGVVYPEWSEGQPTASTTLRYHDIETGKSEPFYRAPEGTVLPLHTEFLPDGSAVVATRLSVAEVPLYAARVTRGSSGFEASTLMKGGELGRLISADEHGVLFRTAQLGNNFGVLKMDPATGKATPLIPASEGSVMNMMQRIGDKLVGRFVDPDQSWRIEVYSMDGKRERTITMDKLGMPGAARISITGLVGDIHSKQWTDFTVSSVSHPPATYRLNLETLQVERMAAPEVDFDSAQVAHRSLSFKASDGADVPLQLYTAKGRRRAPPFTWVFHYGSIGLPNSPDFNQVFQVVLELGGAVAIVGSRGGGERGAEWRNTGTFDRTRTLKDARDAARFLRSEEGLQNMVLSGRSWGGWATLASSALFPDDFVAFHPVVPGGNPAAFIENDGAWAAHDFGARMDAEGRALELETVKARLSTLDPLTLVESLPEGAAPKLLMAVQKADDRVGADQGYVVMDALMRKFGDDPGINMVAMEGGHGAHKETEYVGPWLTSLFPNLIHMPLRKPKGQA